jgi:sugar phosphate isomerase/epimerase
MTKSPKLIASFFTLAGDLLPLSGPMISPYSLRERAEAAASVGYVGLGLFLDDLVHSVARYGFNGVRAILADNGIAYLELEVLLDWFAEGERRAVSDANRHTLLTAAERLGVWDLKVAGDVNGTPWPLDRMIESFHDLCKDADNAGTQICVEVTPVSNIDDLPTAMAIVEGAGAPNGGLLMDNLHVTWGGIPYDAIAKIPARCIKHVEIGDGALTPTGPLMENVLNRRQRPGDGDLDIVGFLESIRETGYDDLYGIEVLSVEHRSLPLEEAARLSHDAGLRYFQQSQGG